MRRRLRKKLRKGEFTELGFVLKFDLSKNLNEDELIEFWETFIEDAIEANGLFCGGSCGPRWDVMVSRGYRQSATVEDQEVLRKWLSNRPDVSHVEVGPLESTW